MDSLLNQVLAFHQIEYLVVNPDWTILEMSPGTQRLTEPTSRLELGQDVRLSLPELIGIEEYLTAILQGRQSHFDLLGIARATANGRPLYLNLQIIRYPNADPAPKLLVFLEDATAGMRLEQSLVQRANESNLLLRTLTASKNYIDQVNSSIPDALLVTTLSGKIKTTNPAAHALFEYEEAELIGQPIAKLIAEQSLDLIEPQRLAEQALANAAMLKNAEVTCRTKTGRIFPAALSYSILKADVEDLEGFVYVIRDITEQKRAEQRLAAEHAITLVLTKSLTLEQAIPNILQVLCEGLEWDLGEFWQLDCQSLVLRSAATWYAPAADFSQFMQASQLLTFAIGLGLPGRIWHNHQATWITNVLEDDNFLRTALAEQSGLQGAVGFPILSNMETLGVMTFFSRQVQQVDTTLLTMMTAIGRQIGQFIKRKQTEEALRQSENRFRSAFDHAAIGMAIVSPNGHWLQVNRSLCDILGYSEQELLSETFQNITYPDDLEVDLNHMRQMLAGEIQTYQLEKRYFHKLGHVVWVWLSVSLVHDMQGQPLHCIAQIQDITARKQAEETLRQQLQQTLLLRQITEEIRQSLDAKQIFQTTAIQIGRAFQVSRCVIHAYIATAKQAKLFSLKKSNSDAFPQIPFVAEYLEPAYESMLNWQVPLAGNPHAEKLLTQDAAIASTNVYTDPLLKNAVQLCQQIGLKSMLAIRTSSQQEPNGVIGLHQCDRFREWSSDEIQLLEAVAGQVGIALAQARLLEQETDQREQLTQQNFALEKARRAADQANRAKSEFLAVISHEIRTPMNGVVGMTALLLNTELTARQKSYVGMLQTSGDALLSVISDVLDFSKIESGKLELEAQPFDLRTCIQDCLNLLAPKAAEKAIELSFIDDSNLPDTVIGDVTRLRQILTNLLSNAVKFTESGEVVVSVTADPVAVKAEKPRNRRAANQKVGLQKIQFTVADTGIGIPLNRLNRLFKGFSQVDSSITRRYGGTGLGLAISKKLSEMMGGEIWVESQVGQGSKFYFTIITTVPSEPMPNQTHLSRSIDSQMSEQLPLRILLAEDHAINQKMALLILEKMGYRADVVNNGLEVLSALRRQLYDVVLMDIQMPKMDGLAATQQICQEWALEQRPYIIAMTASALQADRQICLAAGMDDYITKPIRIERLRQALSKCQLRLDHSLATQLDNGQSNSIDKQAEFIFQKLEDVPMTVSGRLSTDTTNFAEYSSAATPSSIDNNALQQIQRMVQTNSAEFLIETIDFYLEEAPKLLQVAHTSLAQDDHKTLRRIAHTLHSSSATLGATHLAALCQQLETIAATGVIEAAPAQMLQIETEYQQVDIALKLERQKYSTTHVLHQSLEE